MSARPRIDHLLLALGLLWSLVLSCTPELCAQPWAFGVTAGLIGVNVVGSFLILTIKRRLPIALNCLQIALFGFLNFQFYQVYGSEHYRCDHDPRFYDWIEFTAAHALRAADLLDVLDEYGINLQVIHHNSFWSALVLLCMHISVDTFLLGLAIRWFSRLWPKQTEPELARDRRGCAVLLAVIVVYVTVAATQLWAWRDWLLWPLENTARVLDIGDAMRLFDVRWHSIESGFWLDTCALVFRLAVGIWLARLLLRLRFALLRGWGLSVDELVEILHDGDESARAGAARELGASTREPDIAVPALIAALDDAAVQVRFRAAQALGRFHADASEAAPELAKALMSLHAPLRLAAADALGRIGPAAHDVADDLFLQLRIGDAAMKRSAQHALQKVVSPREYHRRMRRLQELQTLSDAPTRPPTGTSFLRALCCRDSWSLLLKSKMFGLCVLGLMWLAIGGLVQRIIVDETRTSPALVYLLIGGYVGSCLGLIVGATRGSGWPAALTAFCIALAGFAIGAALGGVIGWIALAMGRAIFRLDAIDSLSQAVILLKFALAMLPW